MEPIKYLTTIFVTSVQQEFEVISYSETKHTAGERALDFFRKENPALTYKSIEYMITVKWPHIIEKNMLVNTKKRI